MRAAELLGTAAERGHVEAQVDLGRAYKEGAGVARDGGAAERWLRRAAEQGSPRAMASKTSTISLIAAAS